MNLKTTYLGLRLDSPLMAGASPLPNDLDMARRLEDAGAAAIVMPSLFEEQITREQFGTIYDLEAGSESFAEATTYFARLDDLRLGPDNYLEQIRKVKAAVAIPVIGSLNGVTPSGWLEFAGQIQEAGADALELNLYYLATDPRRLRRRVEQGLLESVRTVKAAVKLPVAVKLSPFFTSLAALRQGPGRGRRRRPGAVQPLLPARPGHRGPGGGAQPQPLHAAPPCACACAGWAPSTARSACPWR